MKINKSMILKSTFAVALIALAMLWSVNRAGAFTLIEHEMLFPGVGITRGQTARINVTNLSDSSLNFTLSAFDNNHVNHLPPTEMTIEPGQTKYVDLNADRLVILEGRQQIRAAVDYFVGDPQFHAGGGGGGAGRPAAMGSLEVIDNDTGKTQVFLLPAVQ